MKLGIGRKSLTTVSAALLLTIATSPTFAKPSPADNGVDSKKDKTKYFQLFNGKFIIPTEVINPLELPESLLLIDDYGTPQAKAEWVKVLPGRPELKGDFVNEMVFQSILDASIAASANYFIVTASASGQSKVEVLVENVYRVGGAPFSTPEIKAAAQAMIGEYLKPNRRYFYVQHALYTTIKHKNYSQVQGNAKFAGVGFGAEGKVYASNQGFVLEKLVSINALELRPSPSGALGDPGFIEDRPAGPPLQLPTALQVVPNTGARKGMRIKNLKPVETP